MFARKPRVLKQGKKAQLSYELPDRLHSSILYPARSPNGSDIIIAGHSSGLSIAWRGGRPVRGAPEQPIEESQSLVNGVSSSHDSMAVDSTEEQGLEAFAEYPDSDDEAEVIVENDYEEELDPEELYPPIRQQIDIPLGLQVLSIAAPDLPPPSVLRSSTEVPVLMKNSIVVAITCSDRTIRLVTLPLPPPTEKNKSNNRLGIKTCILNWGATGQEVLRDLAISWTSSRSGTSDNDMELDVRDSRTRAENKKKKDLPLDILVATATSGQSGRLLFYRIPVQSFGGRGTFSLDNVEPFQIQYLPSMATKITFNISHCPAKRHSQLLVADMKGCVRIYDPLHERGQTQRPSSRDSDYRRANQTGAWLMTFTTGFRMPKNTTSTNPSLASKKRIIDARWVSGGRAIVALLEDGEWGVWDVEGVGPKRANTATSTGFVINGFIGDMTSETGALNSVRGKSLSKLAPMTPNTRRVRQESLFGGSKFVPGAAPQGGLSASGIVSASGNTDDTIVLWYGQEVYTMPSLNTFWQRSINSSGRDPGSLYSPGLSRVDGVDLSGEIINNVYQFPLRSAPASLGNLAQRDLLVVGEHRVVVLAHTRPPTPAKALFAREPESPTFREDQHLLDRGELDLGGMDRILDGMMGVEATNGFGKAKRVGFAR